MGLTVRQARRLLRRLEREGPRGVVHRGRGKAAANRTPPELCQRILSLSRRLTPVQRHPPARGARRARGDHDRSRDATPALAPRRQGTQRARRPRQHRRRREPKERRGEMVQWDGSLHPWVAPGPKWSLLAAVDDADGRALWALFAPAESSAAYLRLLAGVVQRSGSRRASTTTSTARYGAPMAIGALRSSCVASRIRPRSAPSCETLRSIRPSPVRLKARAASNASLGSPRIASSPSSPCARSVHSRRPTTTCRKNGSPT